MEKCGEKTEVYSRVTGYFRPVSNWNKGKKEEFKDRKTYDIGHSTLTHRGPLHPDAPAAEVPTTPAVKSSPVKPATATGIPVRIAAKPQDCVITGIAICLQKNTLNLR